VSREELSHVMDVVLSPESGLLGATARGGDPILCEVGPKTSNSVPRIQVQGLKTRWNHTVHLLTPKPLNPDFLV
jgi:hypothetical protein